MSKNVQLVTMDTAMAKQVVIRNTGRLGMVKCYLGRCEEDGYGVLVALDGGVPMALCVRMCDVDGFFLAPIKKRVRSAVAQNDRPSCSSTHSTQQTIVELLVKGTNTVHSGCIPLLTVSHFYVCR